MSEQDQREFGSQLASERGTTIISDTVVSTIAGLAAQEVEGVHMGGSASRAAGGFLSTITGSEGQTRGISVEVGRVEAAIDLTMGVEYGRNILQTVEEVRRKISERVQSMTGLRVTELNATISDVVFPEGGERRRRTLEDSSRTGAASERLSGGEAYDKPPEGDETAELRPEDVAGARRASREEGGSEGREQG